MKCFRSLALVGLPYIHRSDGRHNRSDWLLITYHAGRPSRPIMTAVVHPATRLAEPVSGAVPAQCNDLGSDRYGRLLGGATAQVESDRARQSRQLLVAQPDLPEPHEPIFMGHSRSHGADI